ncbi:uncharacterized protein LOC135812405 [Sycon ciliatum]|uniref:uncharacterized protein LOC135812405 n=1 Tax=Sycon ciliatum TaxID=27933 RepID=UPI0031F6B37A
MDYRDLNKAIDSNPGPDVPSCDQKLRDWRLPGQEQVIVDIRKAYLQVRLHPSLLPYLAVVWPEKLYVMTRMGFGLAVAPKVMNAIVKFATLDFPQVDNYVDDLFVPEEEAEAVKSKLEHYGLPTKPAEPLAQARVLGLQVSKRDGNLVWKRCDGVSLSCPKNPTKRQISKWCGALTAHCPVCKWLRPAASFLKRMANLSTDGWDDAVPDCVATLCTEFEKQVGCADPVSGRWSINTADSAAWTVWCDASDTAMGVVLDVDGVVVEDKAWLRPSDDKRHNNAELDAVIKGLNLASHWGLQRLVVKTDSKTVHSWLVSMLQDVERVKVGGLHELLVRRRVQIIQEIVKVAGMEVIVACVPSAENRADPCSSYMAGMCQDSQEGRSTRSS